MPDQSDIKHVLDAHHSLSRTILVRSPEDNGILHLLTELFTSHIGLTPPIWRDNTSVR